jgi:hypothetical protein
MFGVALVVGSVAGSIVGAFPPIIVAWISWSTFAEKYSFLGLHSFISFMRESGISVIPRNSYRGLVDDGEFSSWTMGTPHRAEGVSKLVQPRIHPQEPKRENNNL